ncbi:AAA family ATPase [Amycolatopsis sp. cg9]|uniref:AAA family ATPase n=1 Tax=Amycolatopsis sp. cg9 TaxID=3238801 RepID=UPI0035262910
MTTVGIAMPGPDRLPPGPHRDLVEALHELYRGAGKPGLRRIAKAVVDGDFRDTVSHEKISTMLRGESLPSWTKLEPVVRVLAGWSTARLDVDEESVRLQRLWHRAQADEPEELSPPRDWQTDLGDVVGLAPFKEAIHDLASLVEVRRFLGSGDVPLPRFVFAGPPGTGKTEAARMTGPILRELGLLRRGQVVEVSRADFAATYFGQAADRVREAVRSAMDGVLFVDGLLSQPIAESDQEVVDTLVVEMERHHDRLAVIITGNKDDLGAWGAPNPGLASRFTPPVEFPPYTDAELLEILRRAATAKGYDLRPEAAERAAGWLVARRAARPAEFGNALAVRELLAGMESRMARRIGTTTPATPIALLAQDVPGP